MAALLVCLASPAAAQTQFWLENFENGCPSLCPGNGFTGVNGTWNVTDVTPPGSTANIWYVSCAENGKNAGICGTGCAQGGNETLHIGNVAGSPADFFCPSGDCGAAYDASSDWFGTGADVTSDKRIVSPAINTSGKAGISVTFLYIGLADPCTDKTDFVYFDPTVPPTGAWVALDPCLTAPTDCPGGQGRWTLRTLNLPANANDRANVRIGFHWRNNADDAGSDPSFAVNDIRVRYNCLLPVPPLPMDLGNDLRVSKTASVRLDWSLMGPTLPPTTHYHVYRATSPSAFFPSGWTQIAGDAPALTAQIYNDAVLGNGNTYYYDARSADNCESICPKEMSISGSSDAPSCNGIGIVQFASQVSGGQPAFNYTWDFGDGSPLDITPNPLHNYAYPPNTYPVTLTVTDSSLPASQIKMHTFNVGVGPGTLAAAPVNDGPKSAGTPVSFAANPSGGVPPYIFSWNFGDGSAASTAQNPSHAYAAAGSYTAQVRVEDAIRCSVTAPTAVTIDP